MKYVIFILTFLSIMDILSAQQAKNDYNWPLGYTSSLPGYPEYNGAMLNFSTGFLEQQYFDIPLDLGVSAAISDSLGHLQFYSNGCRVANAEHHIMVNGEKINEGGWAYSSSCGIGVGYYGYQGLLILPYPGHYQKYIMLQLNRPDDDRLNKKVLYTVVDMTQDSGRGAVVLKNVLAFPGDTLQDMLTAVRHGNGRDWWIVAPQSNLRPFLVALLDSQGIHTPEEQSLPGVVSMHSWPVQAAFSPNGRKYFAMDVWGQLQVFDFDRCNGQLSHPQQVTFPGDTIFACGVSISPSSRYIYASTGFKLYQLDLLATDLAASRQLIARWDGHVDFQVLATTFFQQVLAPDGQIYMMCTNGTKYLHVIHQPDLPGLACDFEQRAVQLPVWNFSIPNFPHFRLFDMAGSPCDTLGIDGPAPPEDTVVVRPPSCAEALVMYPNPASGQVTLALPQCQAGELTVYDAAGKLVIRKNWPGEVEEMDLDVSVWVPGMYLLRVRLANGERISKPLAVVR